MAAIAGDLRRRLESRHVAGAAVSDDTIEIAPTSGARDRSLEVRVRGAADIEVAFVVPAKDGSPFEQVFAASASEQDAVVREAVGFVSDLVADRVVLAWDARPLVGGRRFLSADDLTPDVLKTLAWVVSWSGAQDR